MRPDRHDDLVSTAAIIAGTTVSVVVTVVSFLLSGDDSAAPEVEISAPSTAEEPVLVVDPVPDDLVRHAIIVRPHDPTASAAEDGDTRRIPPAPGR